MARMFAGGMAGNLDYYGVPALKAALGQLASHPQVDAARIGAVGFCLGGSIVLTWACTDDRLAAIARFYGAAPRPRKADRKSTRLNSSHVEISYAVFCLKKKKKKNTDLRHKKKKQKKTKKRKQEKER